MIHAVHGTSSQVCSVPSASLDVHIRAKGSSRRDSIAPPFRLLLGHHSLTASKTKRSACVGRPLRVCQGVRGKMSCQMGGGGAPRRRGAVDFGGAFGG